MTAPGEFVAANPLPWPGAQRLIAKGVPGGVIAEMNGRGTIGAARVLVTAKGARFEIEGPDARALLAVENGAGEVIDVAALSTTNENEWSLLTGMADLLGEAAMEAAVAGNWRELRLFATPMDWLRGGCAGVCVLAWNRQALGALRTLPEALTLVVGAGVRDRLRALLAYGGLPQVAEIRGSMERAA